MFSTIVVRTLTSLAVFQKIQRHDITVMCRRIIEHWAPCNHMRLLHIVPCDAARGTPGLVYEDCAAGENSFIEEASTAACPVCQRTQALNKHAQGINSDGASSVTTDSPATAVLSHKRSSNRMPTLRQVHSGRHSASHHDTGSTASSMSGFVCGLGEHDFVDIAGGGLLCLKCGTIGAPPDSSGGTSRQYGSRCALESFADDDEGDVASTLRARTSDYGELPEQGRSTPSSARIAATPRPSSVRDTLSLEASASPAPSTMSSNARAEASWAASSEALGRRLPDF